MTSGCRSCPATQPREPLPHRPACRSSRRWRNTSRHWPGSTTPPAGRLVRPPSRQSPVRWPPRSGGPRRNRSARPPGPTGPSGLVVPAAGVAALSGAAASSVPRRPAGRDDPDQRAARCRLVRHRSPGRRRRSLTGAGRGRIRTPWLIGGAILALAILVAGVGVYLLLPSASIAVTPHQEPVGPVDLTVTADTTATAPDATALVVPAQKVTVPVSVNDTFNATGKRVAADQRDGHGPVPEPRSDQHEPDRRRAASSGPRRASASGPLATVTVPQAEHPSALTIFPGPGQRQGHRGRRRPGRQRRRRHDRHRAQRRELAVPQGHQPGADDRRDAARSSPGSPRPMSTARWRRSTPRSRRRSREAMADPALAAGGATVFPATGELGPTTPSVRSGDAGRPGGRDLRPRPVGDRDGHHGRLGAGQRHRRDARCRPRSSRTTRSSPAGRRHGRRRRSSSARPSPSRSTSPPSRSPTSTRRPSRRWSSASRSPRRRPSLRRSARSRSPSRPTGPVRSRASRAGSRSPSEQPAQIETPAPSELGGAMTRLLGIDLGERRVGLALADDDGAAARPLATLKRGRDLDADAARAADRRRSVRGRTSSSSGCRSRRRATRGPRPR